MHSIYQTIKAKLTSIDFNTLWQGFHPFSFALYDEKQVYLEDRVFPKDQRFIGNTAIRFEDQYLAIWQISERDEDLDILTAKIIHEMFHCYQYEMQEMRFPNEILEGLNYRYTLENLSRKYQENLLLIDSFQTFDLERFQECLALRKARSSANEAEVQYESKIEVVEGMAQYIELKALRFLSKAKFHQRLERMIQNIAKKENLLSIRHLSYDVGSLILLFCEQNGLNIGHQIGKVEKTIFELLTLNINPKHVDIGQDNELLALINQNEQAIKHQIEVILNHLNTIIHGPFKIAGLDPLNTKRYGSYLYCKYFLAYKQADEVKSIQSTCVAEMADPLTIAKIIY